MKRTSMIVLLSGCATLATPHDESGIAPSAGIGPFRKLTGTEVKGVAPFVLDDFVAQYQDPEASGEEGGVALFAAASDGPEGVIVRTYATDARSFYGGAGDYVHTPITVLRPSLPWEGKRVFAPSVLWRNGIRWLYYATEGGIGAAMEQGGAWEKSPQPVLSAVGAETWERGLPTSADAVAMPDGTVHLFFTSGTAIGEAVSSDGIHFARVPGGPVLAPSGDGFAAASVGDPDVMLRMTAADRLVVNLFVTATDRAGVTSIGVAGRFGESGPCELRDTPVYAIGKGEKAPSVAAFGELTFLYLTQPQSGSKEYPAVAAAMSPADKILPPPDPFPETL